MTAELSTCEIGRLRKIDKLVNKRTADNLHFITEVRNQFNAAAIAKALTPEEKTAMVDLLKGGIDQNLWSIPVTAEKNAKRAIMSLKVADIFIAAARRTANDDKAMAALLPGKFYKTDPELLEKVELKELAVLVREKLGV
jgi:hypothetical protein